jgi:hypothetical protein
MEQDRTLCSSNRWTVILLMRRSEISFHFTPYVYRGGGLIGMNTERKDEYHNEAEFIPGYPV